jgi:hypothetical protein
MTRFGGGFLRFDSLYWRYRKKRKSSMKRLLFPIKRYVWYELLVVSADKDYVTDLFLGAENILIRGYQIIVS